jgi:hypothetical protein
MKEDISDKNYTWARKNWDNLTIVLGDNMFGGEILNVSIPVLRLMDHL